MKDILEKLVESPLEDISLFELAFTHRSAVNEKKSLEEHNERLEFLGDAVLELIVTEYLYQNLAESPEGELTNLRASLVRTESLAETAKALQFGDLLKMSRGESLFGGREKQSILSNTFEAFIGALYLSLGLEKAKAFILKHLIPKLPAIQQSGSHIDAKSHFQHYAQAVLKATPVYKEISSTGPDHEKIFEVGVFVGDTLYGTGMGSSKQIAQQSAAEDALKKLKSKKKKA